ncbi:restriction endonuclease subunit S [Streptococcus mitis]|uniref:Restriction endonuclease subunit S n=1 Tax=Streptococcus mitis TaxID=28037 RepID=A0A4U1KXI4_STRMT|nr:restriction endonuclease subunit S [Streptococcus mitis]TKD49071.1 restriction endonuclease subunit S [Streptococcus mitis]
MTRMKESGIDWIGQIPEEWEVDFVNHIFEEHKQKNKGNKEKNLLSLSYGHIIRKSIDTSFGLLPESFDTYNIIQRGDIVLRLTDLQNDKRSLRVGLTRENGIITSAYLTLRLKNICCSDSYMYYLLHTYDICKVFYNFGGGVRQGGTWSDIYKMELLIPPKNEQQKISDFLDKKTAQLDKVKALLEEQIQKLKDYRASLIYETVTKGLDTTVPMKDSGIDWIGQIPEEWEVSKLEQYVDIFGRIGFRGYTTNDIVNEGEGAISYSPSNIIDYSVIDNNNTYISWSKYDESPEIQIKTGDVLYVKTGSSYGKAGIVNKLSNKATINPQLVVLKPKKNTDSRLINYFLNSSVGKDQSELIVGGSTIPTITQESIKKMIFPKMSFEEQQKIADFLDKKTIQIDKLIQIKNQQIENINKQRQTLIYDYVTGKRRV